MKPMHEITRTADDIESLMAVCCGNPHDEELPQVAAEEDIVMDVYSDILNMPRDYAAARFHHQYDDDFSFDDLIH